LILLIIEVLHTINASMNSTFLNQESNREDRQIIPYHRVDLDSY